MYCYMRSLTVPQGTMLAIILETKNGYSTSSIDPECGIHKGLDKKHHS